ncbi:hypothetical protein COO60DRAFT_531689 [Scenedesmus sp. NREL 46B-D3]|nr:hypothetical protein COO60DRAFT_531689 [Scenedesmus sp. NREL 46B-D3]
MLLSGVKQAAGLSTSSSTRRAAASVFPHLSMHTPAHCSSTAMGCSGNTLGATADPAATAAEPTAAAAGLAVDPAAEPAAKKVKRNVALHVGYVGTAYTGLQANRELPHLATVEGVLEKAILAAGLISEANFGDFRRTKWTRSSRTDKGVHSLCTVVGLRILMDDATYREDPRASATRAPSTRTCPRTCASSACSAPTSPSTRAAGVAAAPTSTTCPQRRCASTALTAAARQTRPAWPC